jgi:hypothetical protein
VTAFTTGDTAPDFTATLSNVDPVSNVSTPANLTGATVVLHFTRPDATILTVTAALVLATAGTIAYTWVTGDLSVAGPWRVEAQVTFSNGRIQTFGPMAFGVTKQIA